MRCHTPLYVWALGHVLAPGVTDLEEGYVRDEDKGFGVC